jgi:hypothetical protein
MAANASGPAPRKEGPLLGLAAAVALGVLSVAGAAQAYRPFDSTDASVPAPGEFELELGPLGLIEEGGRRTLVAPKVILNLGVWHNWEVVLEGRQLVSLGQPTDGPRYRLVDTGAFIKGVVRRGSLQGETAPSVGVEVGALLPTVNGDPGMGFAGLLILSHRLPALTAHLNGVATFTRTQDWAFATGLILEGPSSWVVRPVGETVVEQVVGGERLLSGLIGAIWRADEDLVLDLAGRSVRAGDTNVWEIRAGLTWFTQLWRPE